MSPHRELASAEEKRYIRTAIGSGLSGNAETVMMLLLARLHGKHVSEIRNMYVDLQAAYQEVYREMYTAITVDQSEVEKIISETNTKLDNIP